jgi:hypothetical protein
MWADGMSHNEDFAITQDTVITYVADWPVPVTRNPDLDEPPAFDDE